MVDLKLYAAPMEGLTTCWWRQAHRVLFGGADKGRHAHGLQLLAKGLDAGAFVAALRQGDALRGGALALPQLGHVLQIVVKKGHSYSLAFQKNIVT